MTEYQTAENYDSCLNQDAQNKILTLQIKDLRNQIKELRKELKRHISNCPFREIKA